MRVLDNAPGLFADELTSKGAILTLGSVTDEAVVNRVMPDVEQVFHVAAVFRQINLPDRVYHEVNAVGTKTVGEAALRHKVTSFVYCSTQGVHGDIKSPPGDEDSPIQPEDYYQQDQIRRRAGDRRRSSHGGYPPRRCDPWPSTDPVTRPGFSTSSVPSSAVGS